MDTRVVTEPEQPGAGILHVGPFDTIGADYERLGAWMAGHPSVVRGAPRSVYLDDPDQTPAEELRTWVVVPVSETVVLSEQDAPVVSFDLVGGSYLVGVHRGSYAGLGGAWSQFMAALEAGGHRMDESRPSFEVYLSDPSATPEDELLTELYQPIG